MRQSIILLMLFMALVVYSNAQVIDSLKDNQVREEMFSIDENKRFTPFEFGFQEIPGLSPSFGFRLNDFQSSLETPTIKANPKAFDFENLKRNRQYFSVNSNLLGYYRKGKYNLNDKMTIYSSMVLPGKYYGVQNVPLGNYPQLNFGNSLGVGYKFSDKFSIRAGFSVGRYEKVW